MTRLVTLFAVVAVVLAACGGTSSNRSAEGAYQQLSDATSTMAGNGAKYALILQDCTATATGATAAADCGRQLLQRLGQDFAPIQAAIDAVSGVAGGSCKAALDKAASAAPLLDGKDPGALDDAQEAEALGSQVADQLQQFAQAIAAAKSACA